MRGVWTTIWVSVLNVILYKFSNICHQWLPFLPQERIQGWGAEIEPNPILAPHMGQPSSFPFPIPSPTYPFFISPAFQHLPLPLLHSISLPSFPGSLPTRFLHSFIFPFPCFSPSSLHLPPLFLLSVPTPCFVFSPFLFALFSPSLSYSFPFCSPPPFFALLPPLSKVPSVGPVVVPTRFQYVK